VDLGVVVVGFLLALLLAVLVFGAVWVRRQLLQRGGGSVELSLRLKPNPRGRGWVLGIGRFVGDDLQWHRVFSLARRPRRTLSRRDLQVLRQRPPERAEAYALLQGAVVMECRSSASPVELAMEPCAVTGFLAWLEARPPGATLPPA
jgi:hypothetical protein